MPDSTPHHLPIEELERLIETMNSRKVWHQADEAAWMIAAQVPALLSRLSELEALRAEAVKALEPFAKHWAHAGADLTKAERLLIYRQNVYTADFANAASTLALLRGKGEEQ